MSGQKPVAPENQNFKCRECGTNDRLFYEIGETHDGAYDTITYECKACGSWWRVVVEVD